MSESIQKTLLALKDVHGTRGSFVLNREGKLLAMEMPSLFDVAMFAEIGPRIERLAESFAALGDELESCLVRFSDHLLFIKQFAKGGTLCILTDGGVNLPALKMAINIAHKRLINDVATAEPIATEPEAPSVVAPAATPLAAPAVQPAVAAAAMPAGARSADGRSARYYRGHLVED